MGIWQSMALGGTAPVVNVGGPTSPAKPSAFEPTLAEGALTLLQKEMVRYRVGVECETWQGVHDALESQDSRRVRNIYLALGLPAEEKPEKNGDKITAVYQALRVRAGAEAATPAAAGTVQA